MRTPDDIEAWIDLPGGLTLDKLLEGIVVCCLTWGLILLLHAYQHRKNGFSIRVWAKDRASTIMVGLIVTLIIAALRGFTSDMKQLLILLGFQPGPSAAISLGLAIAALLLGFKPSPAMKEERKEHARLEKEEKERNSAES